MNEKAAPQRKKSRPRHATKPQHHEAALFDVASLEQLAGPQLFNRVHSAKVTAANGEVLVAIQAPSSDALTAHIPSEEFGSTLPAVGSEISVYLADPPRNKEDGSKEAIQASFLKAQELRDWQRLEDAMAQKALVKGMLVGAIKGGFSVALLAESQKEADAGRGLRAFLPRKQAGLSERDLPSIFSHEPYEFSLLEVAAEKGSIIVSRREILQLAKKERKHAFWGTVKVGDVVEGVVRHLMPYGAFVEVNGADALLHASDLVWHKQPHVEEILHVGQALTLQVIEADPEKHKLKVGLKQLTPDPWESIREHFRTGMEVEGTAVAIADFGVFIRLQDGIEGLVHLSEMSWQRLKHPSQKFKIGDTVRARILSLDQQHHRISLSTKALEANPIDSIAEKFPSGTVVKTTILQIKEFGVFVDLDASVMGLVHVTELSWTRHVEHPSELHSEGQEVEVVILGFDPERQRVACSIKRLSEDPWLSWKEKYAKGTRHQATVKKVVNAGAECELEDGLIAFCTSKELSSEGADRAQDQVKVGQVLDVEVIHCDPAHHKITISVKARAEKEIREDYEQYMKKQNQSGAGKITMADAVGSATSRSKH